MRRTRDTAAPYCQKYGIEPAILPCLNEFSCLSFDLIRGMDGEARRPPAQAYWQHADPHRRTGQGADTFAEFDARVEAFLQNACRSLPDGALLFGHGIWIAMLVWKLLGFQAALSADMSAFRAFQTHLPMPNAAVWQLCGSETGWRLSFQAA